MSKIEFIKKEYYEHKNEYLYMIHTEYKNGEPYFKIEDVNPDHLFWGEFICNFDLYKKSLDDCIKSVNGTRKPILYRGENINHIKESVFLTYNPYNGEIYREYIY